MPEKVVGSIYPAALIGKTPIFGNVYIPYRLIFTSERVVAFYPDAKKAFRSGPKLFKAYEHRKSRWKELVAGFAPDQMVCQGNEGVGDEMLRPGGEPGYGALSCDRIGGVLLRPGADGQEFNLLFRPADKVLVRGLEFCIARPALEQRVRELLGKTPLSDRIENQV